MSISEVTDKKGPPPTKSPLFSGCMSALTVAQSALADDVSHSFLKNLSSPARKKLKS